MIDSKFTNALNAYITDRMSEYDFTLSDTDRKSIIDEITEYCSDPETSVDRIKITNIITTRLNRFHKTYLLVDFCRYFNDNAELLKRMKKNKWKNDELMTIFREYCDANDRHGDDILKCELMLAFSLSHEFLN